MDKKKKVILILLYFVSSFKMFINLGFNKNLYQDDDIFIFQYFLTIHDYFKKKKM